MRVCHERYRYVYERSFVQRGRNKNENAFNESVTHMRCSLRIILFDILIVLRYESSRLAHLVIWKRIQKTSKTFPNIQL